VTQVISRRDDLCAPADNIREAIATGVAMARDQIGIVATLITRIEPCGPVTRSTGLLTHVVTELVVDAAHAFAGTAADGNVVVVSSQRIAGYVVVRVADNATGLPRHSLCLAGVIERIGGELRVETGPGGGTAVTVMLPFPPA
jgi:signal transduction histidine kinase